MTKRCTWMIAGVLFLLPAAVAAQGGEMQAWQGQTVADLEQMRDKFISLPEPLRSDECVAQAKQRGVLIAGAEFFAVGREVPHAVRVSIAAVPHREDVRRGLLVLAEILDGVSDRCVQIL